MIIYIDKDYKCHTINDGTMIAIEEEFFDGKCQTFIEGYCLVPVGAEYKGEVQSGTNVFPWEDYNILLIAQMEYELELAKAQNAEYEAALTEIENALGVNNNDNN